VSVAVGESALLVSAAVYGSEHGPSRSVALTCRPPGRSDGGRRSKAAATIMLVHRGPRVRGQLRRGGAMADLLARCVVPAWAVLFVTWAWPAPASRADAAAGREPLMAVLLAASCWGERLSGRAVVDTWASCLAGGRGSPSNPVGPAGTDTHGGNVLVSARGWWPAPVTDRQPSLQNDGGEGVNESPGRAHGGMMSVVPLVMAPGQPAAAVSRLGAVGAGGWPGCIGGGRMWRGRWCPVQKGKPGKGRTETR